jgi:hypothetical protein
MWDVAKYLAQTVLDDCRWPWDGKKYPPMQAITPELLLVLLTPPPSSLIIDYDYLDYLLCVHPETLALESDGTEAMATGLGLEVAPLSRIMDC